MVTKLRGCRGTVISYFLVLVSVLTTGLLTTMALTSGEESQVANVTLKRDQCFYAAEAGVEQAYWLLEYNPTWFPVSGGTATTTGTVGGATYTVTATGAWNSPILITSVGSANNGATSVTVIATASPAGVIVPAITLGGNFDNSGNVNITGDIATLGTITTTGTLKETGSLYAAGTITTQGSVTISGTSNPNYPVPPIPPIDTVGLTSGVYGPVTIVNVPNNGHVFNVTSVNLGQGGVVYFRGGPIQFKGSVNVSGYGTIVTDSSVSIQSAASLGSSSQPATLNLVVGIGPNGGNLDIGGYLGLVGSLYVNNGSITKNGGLNITGVVEATAVSGGTGNLNTNGGFTLTRAQPPAFDTQRYNPNLGSGQGSFLLAGVTGPIF